MCLGSTAIGLPNHRITLQQKDLACRFLVYRPRYLVQVKKNIVKRFLSFIWATITKGSYCLNSLFSSICLFSTVAISFSALSIRSPLFIAAQNNGTALFGSFSITCRKQDKKTKTSDLAYENF